MRSLFFYNSPTTGISTWVLTLNIEKSVISRIHIDNLLVVLFNVLYEPEKKCSWFLNYFTIEIAPLQKSQQGRWLEDEESLQRGTEQLEQSA